MFFVPFFSLNCKSNINYLMHVVTTHSCYDLTEHRYLSCLLKHYDIQEITLTECLRHETQSTPRWSWAGWQTQGLHVSPSLWVTPRTDHQASINTWWSVLSRETHDQSSEKSLCRYVKIYRKELISKNAMQVYKSGVNTPTSWLSGQSFQLFRQRLVFKIARLLLHPRTQHRTYPTRKKNNREKSNKNAWREFSTHPHAQRLTCMWSLHMYTMLHVHVIVTISTWHKKTQVLSLNEPPTLYNKRRWQQYLCWWDNTCSFCR